MAWLGLVVGVFLGSLLLGTSGWLSGALLGWLLGSQIELRHKLRQLQQRMDALTPVTVRHPVASPLPQQEVPAPSAVSPPIISTAAPASQDDPPAAIVSEPAAVIPRPEPQPVPSPATPPLPPRPAKPSSSDQDEVESAWSAGLLERLLGGNLVAKIGMVILFVGLAFLAKFAVAHAVIPLEVRMTGIALIGVILLGVGWFTRLRHSNFSAILQGGGVGVLYLTTFAAYKLYHMLSPGMAFSILTAVAVLSAILALLQDSRWLALAGTTGGFLSPVLASSGSGDHVALFSYYLLLNVGIAIIASRKAWRSLNVLGFVFTFAIGAIWGGLRYQASDFATTEPFLIVFFLLYVGITVYFATLREDSRTGLGMVDGTLVFGVPIVGFGLQAAMVHDYAFATAGSAVALSAFYLGMALLVRRRTSLALLAESFWALGVIFVTLAIPLALDAQWTAAAWGIEAAGIIWMGARQQKVMARAFGSLVLVAAGVCAGMGIFSLKSDASVVNGAVLGCLLVAVGAYVAGRTNHHYQAQLSHAERGIAFGWLIWSLLWWFLAAATEIDRFVTTSLQHAVGIGFQALTALLLAELGHRLAWPTSALASLGLLPLVVVVMVSAAERHHSPFEAGGWLAWLSVAFVHIYVLRCRTTDIDRPYQQAAHMLGVWVLAAVLAWQGYAWVGDAGDVRNAWRHLGWIVGILLVLGGLSTRKIYSVWPMCTFRKAYEWLALWPLAVLALLWVVFTNAVSTGDASPLPYLPVLSPLDVGVAAALVLTLRWASQPRSFVRLMRSQGRRPSLILFGVAGFAWLNGMLLRTLFHYFAVDYRPHAWLSSHLAQASLAILWTLVALALMVAANKLARRWLWMAGAAVLAPVAIKLMLVDFFNAGGMAQIISLIGVGALMLVIAYIAPLPPRKDSRS